MPEPRVRVCLTFDMDGMSGPLSRNTRLLPSILSRAEYGPRVGTPRLLAKLAKYGIRSTWFIPGHTADTHPERAAAVVEAAGPSSSAWSTVTPTTSAAAAAAASPTRSRARRCDTRRE